MVQMAFSLFYPTSNLLSCSGTPRSLKPLRASSTRLSGFCLQYVFSAITTLTAFVPALQSQIVSLLCRGILLLGCLRAFNPSIRAMGLVLFKVSFLRSWFLLRRMKSPIWLVSCQGIAGFLSPFPCG